ncbi:FHA domain-containing protein [Roseovarius sp. CAU 1744]|uniref:FHA domain-containing protein n=1 Tax=Roseovarius sp. CAU 1744 TaxID=3140368 RepID=UPI00325C06D6
MKFIRDLIEEKSRSIQEQADKHQNDTSFEAPRADPPARETFAAVPVGPVPGAPAKMEPEDTHEEIGQLDLSELNDLRRALANSDEPEESSPEIFEDELEFSDTPDISEEPEPEQDAPVEAEVEQPEQEQLVAEPPAEIDPPETLAEDHVEDIAEGAVEDTVEDIVENIVEEQVTAEVTEIQQAPLEVPMPAAGRGNRQSGRVKTRILGFSSPGATAADPFEKAGETASAQVSKFPVGWLAVVDGPGRGAAFTIFDGVAQIGRGEDQPIRLDFGDSSISRQNHAAIAYDNEQKSFFLGHGGKANLVRLNGRPVLSTEELQSEDTVRIGETTLRFIALCGQNFTWDQDQEGEARNASVG